MIKLKLNWAQAITDQFKAKKHGPKCTCPCKYMTPAARIKAIDKLILSGEAVVLDQ